MKTDKVITTEQQMTAGRQIAQQMWELIGGDDKPANDVLQDVAFSNNPLEERDGGTLIEDKEVRDYLRGLTEEKKRNWIVKFVRL